MTLTCDELPLLALYGPTSSGKTRLSLELADLMRGSLGLEAAVISADSRQVYRHMDIGTSKTRREEMRGIPHEMIDVAEPVRKLELEDYARQARGRIAAHREGGRVPFVVGGTGTYVGALVEGWDVSGTSAQRAELERDFPRSATAEAYALLRRVAPQVAANVHRSNREAILNALTVALAGVRSGGSSAWPAVVLGLDPGPRALARTIRRTLDAQFEAGLHGEVVDLAARYDLDTEARRRGAASRNQVLHTHGYREFFDVAGRRRAPVAALGARELATVRDEIAEHVLAYARRQRSWLRKLPRPTMVTTAEQALTVVERELAAKPPYS
jgi:tRNA dimethylallyltransferase